MSETSGQERNRAEVCLDELEGERISDGSEEIEETEIETKAEAKISGWSGQPRKAISMPSTRLPVCTQKDRAWKEI